MLLRRILRWCIYFLLVLVLTAVGLTWRSYRVARLDFDNLDDQLTIEKNIGFYPTSRVAYAAGSGFVDPTVFYKILVQPDEVAWLTNHMAIPRFDKPGHAPFWWRIPTGQAVRYYKSDDKWPKYFAYDPISGWLYGTYEYD